MRKTKRAEGPIVIRGRLIGAIGRPGTPAAETRGRLIPVLLAISLVCNITALVVPFLEIDTFFGHERIYSLPHSVALMWEAKLYAIALLIVVFSIIFPFIKLGVLSSIWFVSTSVADRGGLLKRVEVLGKWSMLDVFVVIIILVLTNDQFFIRTTPLWGIYFFLTAIILSMTVTELIKRILYPDRLPTAGVPHIGRKRLATLGGWRRWIVPALLLLTLVTLVAAIGFPFLQISEFFLAKNSYSIFRSFLALWHSGCPLLSLAALLFMIVSPLLNTAMAVVLWWRAFDPAVRSRWERFMEFLSHWSMLDVFSLALLVFLIEGSTLIDTRTRPGLYLLVAALVVSHASSVATNRIRRGMEHE